MTENKQVCTSEDKNKGRVLLVEDDDALRDLLSDELEDEKIKVTAVDSAEEAAAELNTFCPDIVISDVRLPGRSGIELLNDVQAIEEGERPAFVIITAFGSIDQAVSALKNGADDFLTKPLDLDYLRIRVRRLLQIQHMKWEARQYQYMKEHDRLHGIVIRSPAMKTVADNIRNVASARGPVLIQGETGVGKEMVARAIHKESTRKDKPFIPINCAGIPATLVESEFFGHAQGAFTGANRSRPGLFAAAAGGTIFLDEIGELPHPLQAKLLRVLQDGEVRQLGSTTSSEVDVRVIAATNRDIQDTVNTGGFRRDLFYRLAIYIIKIPPLRRRKEDIQPLAFLFLDRYVEETGKRIKGFSPNALSSLKSWDFPGNVRELQNLIERAVTFAQEEIITTKYLPDYLKKQKKNATTSKTEETKLRETNENFFAHGVHEIDVPQTMIAEQEPLHLEEAKQRYVRHILSLTQGNKRKAAELLGISRRTLYRYLDKNESDTEEL